MWHFLNAVVQLLWFSAPMCPVSSEFEECCSARVANWIKASSGEKWMEWLYSPLHKIIGHNLTNASQILQSSLNAWALHLSIFVKHQYCFASCEVADLEGNFLTFFWFFLLFLSFFLVSSWWCYMVYGDRNEADTVVQLCALRQGGLLRHALHVALCKRFTSLGTSHKAKQFKNSMLC